MKRIIATMLMVSSMLTIQAQGLGFNIYGNYSKPVKQEQLLNAKSLVDINPGFPASWIGSYKSVKVMMISGVDTVTTESYDDKLLNDQKVLLSKLDLGAKVAVEIEYLPKSNSLEVDSKTMTFTHTVAPEKEAEYDGGYMVLKDYINNQALSKINTLVHHQLKTAIISFTINEDGNTVEAHINQSTENVDIDQLLLRTICDMPKWKPAKNRLGQTISQEFQFKVGTEEGC